MDEINLAEKIRKVHSSESAILVSRKVLSQAGWNSNLEADYVSYLTGKARKTLSKKVDGWLISFKLLVPEGSSPDCMWVELYPHLGEFYIPSVF
jgi:hypothetical protein